MAPLLEVRDLVTAYGAIEALKGVSLGVDEGSITCLLGPNGAGKTTLMFSIAGVLTPRRGSIRLAGEDIAGRPAAAVVRRGSRWCPRTGWCSPP